jgi:hypothetical protein
MLMEVAGLHIIRDITLMMLKDGEGRNLIYSNMDISSLKWSLLMPSQSPIGKIFWNLKFIFSVSNPQVIAAGIAFFIIRHFVDAFNLLVVFKNEIDSSGHLVKSIL